MLSVVVFFGMILLWDVDGGFIQIDKYLYFFEDYIKLGVFFVCGIVNFGVWNECDFVLVLFLDYVFYNSNIMRFGFIFGLGLVYVGLNCEDVLILLLFVMGDLKFSMEVVGVIVLVCGMIVVGFCNGDVIFIIFQIIMEKLEIEFKDIYVCWFFFGLGFNYLGKGEVIEVILVVLEVVLELFCSFVNILVDVCVYVGFGNVLKVQQLFYICSEYFDFKEKEEDKDKKEKKDKDKKEVFVDMGVYQGVVVLGIVFIVMGEEIGVEMVL